MTPTQIAAKGTNTLGGQTVTPTLIDIDRLEGELVGHPDKAFVTNFITVLREDAFKQIPSHQSLWHLYGVEWRMFFYTRLVLAAFPVQIFC